MMILWKYIIFLLLNLVREEKIIIAYFWLLKRCKNKNPICIGVEDFKLLVIRFVPISLTYIYDSHLLNIASTGE